jgi:hypothetical protein
VTVSKEKKTIKKNREGQNQKKKQTTKKVIKK